MVKQLFRIITTLAAALIGLAILVFIIGNCVDFFSTTASKKESDQALEEFAVLDRDEDGNAWHYYLQAIHLMEMMTFDATIDRYLQHSVAYSGNVEKALNRHGEITGLVRKGAAQPYCHIPIDYEKGPHAVLPNYRKLMECAKILNAQILVALEHGNNERAVSNIIDGFTLSRHIMNGTPVSLNYRVGIRMLNLFASTLVIALSTGAFDSNDLTQLVTVLDGYERTIPSAVWVLQAENNSMKIVLGAIPSLYPLFEQIEMMKANIFDELGIRLGFWRYGFSAKLAALSAVREIDGLFLDMQGQEGNTSSVEDDMLHVNVFDEFMQGYKSKNDIVSLFAANWRGIFKSRAQCLAHIRLLHSAALLWLYRSKSGDFPPLLAAFDASRVMDPFTGRAWEYIMTDGIVTVKSPGEDLDFDTKDDLSITLYKQNVAEYLKHIRQ
jgi:hypothetical protein